MLVLGVVGASREFRGDDGVEESQKNGGGLIPSHIKTEPPQISPSLSGYFNENRAVPQFE
jgi:hypothetical protein